LTTPVPSTLIHVLGLQDTPPTPSATTLLQYIQNSGFVGFVLIILSVIAVSLIVAHFIVVRRSRLAPPDVIEGLAKYLREGDTDGAVRFLAAPENESFLARLFGSALRRCARSTLGLLELRTALEDAGQREADRLYRQTDLIGLIAALGPMLGLLGTVFGMIGAFGSISSLEGAARSSELARFMSLALINTAQGLAVAIPCTAAFSLFRRRIDAATTDVAQLVEELAGLVVAPSGNPAGGPRPVARPATGVQRANAGPPGGAGPVAQPARPPAA